MRTLGEIKPGQTIGRYEFLIPVAEGGMASVWAARMKGTRGFQKNLAVKMMLSSLSDNPQFEQMFLDEARIASKIHHPNVVEIFDLGEESEVLYIVMEYIDGEPLSTVFRTAQKKQGIPLPIALRIMSEACAGLHAAHELNDENGETVGLVHRDVSPQNILVSYDGTVKIVDFGVALAEGRNSDKTSAGTVKGKAPYMSPEQALGRPLDRRTDIFALGIVLYHLTTGKHPFRSETDILTLHNIIETEPQAPSEVVAGYPRALESVVLKALEKNPAKRFQTMEEFELAIERAQPPAQDRIRPSDVARFVRETVGERGEKRREALRAAVRLADDRLQNELDTAKLAARPISELGLTAPGFLPAPRNSDRHMPPPIGPGSLPRLGLPNVNHTGSLPAIDRTGALPAFVSNDPALAEDPPPSLSPATGMNGVIGMVASTPPPPPSTDAIPLMRPAPPSRKGPIVMGGALLAVVVGVAAFASMRSGPTQPTTTRAAADQPTATPTATTRPADPTPVATATATTTATAASAAPSVSAPSIDLNNLPVAGGPSPYRQPGSGSPVAPATVDTAPATPTTTPATAAPTATQAPTAAATATQAPVATTAAPPATAAPTATVKKPTGVSAINDPGF